MSMTELQAHILSYFLATQADDVVIAGRFFPKSDFILTFEDKLKIAARAFGRPVTNHAKGAAEPFVDLLIDKGGLSTQTGKFNSVMHQFQNDRYREIVAELRAADPIVAKAAAEGEGYWEAAFARLAA